MRRFRSFGLFVVVAIVLGLASTPPAAAAPDAGSAQKFIRTLADKAVAVVKADEVPKSDRSRQLRQILRDHFDVRTIGIFALGVHRRQSTPEQISIYLEEFEDYVVYTYSTRLEKYAGETVAVTGTRPAGSSKTDIFVTSEIVRQGKEPIPITWRVRDRKGTLQVIDVEIEGTNQIVTYRQEFAAVIKRRGNGVEGLITELREKNASLQGKLASN
ncbi:MAG: ABC transporter substrate-binding protein [Alphaproteobacteria bacterium]|nr:ABC transporter substrate-binding protein [Alphaproteobacteria bacterium]